MAIPTLVKSQTLNHKKLTAGQRKLLTAIAARRHRRVIWIGAIRQGKTVGLVLGAIASLYWAAAAGRGNGVAILAGHTLGSLQRNCDEYIMELAESWGLPAKRVGGVLPHYLIGDIGRIYLFGASNQYSYRPLRGITAHHAFIDEATICDRGFIEICEDRLSFADSMLVLVSNADSPQHWLKTDWIDNPAPGTLSIESDIYDNPYYSEARRDFLLERDNNTAHYRRMIRNEWSAEDGLVMPIQAQHLTAALPPTKVGHVYMDPGTAGITAALLFVHLGRNRWVVADEYYWQADKQGRLSDEQHLNNLRLKGWTIQRICIDTEDASMVLAARRLGLHPVGPRKAIHEGINVVNDALAMGLIKIHEGCKSLLNELATYRWDAARRTPARSPDHAADCLRYGCMEKFGGNRATLLA